MLSPSVSRRRGVAAVEMAFIAPLLFFLMVGIWEVGRYIMVMNILDNAAREGGRLAASDVYFSSNNHQDPSTSPVSTLTLSPPSTNADYEVQKKVVIYLQAANLTTTNVTVKVQNDGQTSSAKTWNYTYNATSATGSGSGYDPSAAASQLDKLTVTVTMPYSNVGWSLLGKFIGTSSTMTASSTWPAMRNTPLVVSTTIPTKPLQSGDALP